MNGERDLERLIDRLVSGEASAGDRFDTGPSEASGASGLQALGKIFAGFSALRGAAHDGDPDRAEVAVVRSAGQRVGVFRLVRQIGSGGMGDVWLAERRDGTVEQRVAIKYLRRARARTIELFEREQRLLARLAHPNIARFIDAGRDEHGVHYLIMEYVDGIAIGEQCDRNTTDVHARLAMFLKVCDAVEYAHRQLIVHRDIKPANVLVDGEGSPKLLDFGVGKLLDVSLMPETTTFAPAMTVAYAAPEQFRGDPATTATDVFSLGLLLFRLLAGELPPSRRSGSLAQLALSGEVERLSATAADGTMTGVGRALAGDLDAIVAKATRTDIDERYGSVAEFSDDVRRFMDGRPVRARVPTKRYRLRKFVVRHRVGVAASFVAVIGLLASLGVALWQAGVARDEARRADAQTARASRVAGFMTSLFREQDPRARNTAKARSANELVAEGVSRVRSELADQPDVRASLIGVLGEATMNLGDLDGGRKLIEEARGSVPDNSLEAAKLDGLLGNIAIRQGHRNEGVALLEPALARLRAGQPADRVLAASLGIRLAFRLHDEGKPDIALAMLRESHEEVSAILGADHVDAIYLETAIVTMLGQMRRDDEAEAAGKDVVERIERVAGPESPRLPDVLMDLALIEKRRGRYAESRALFERAIVLSRQHQGPVNEFLAALYSRLANLHQDNGHPTEALAALDQAGQALPDGSGIEQAQMLATRGDTLIDLGRFEEAEADLREALRLRRASSGDDDALVWYSQSELGKALTAQGRFADARRMQLEALSQMERIMGKDAYQLTFVLRALAMTFEESGDPASAVPLYRRALGLAEAKYPKASTVVVQYRAGLASALRNSGDVDAAIAEADAVLADREGHPELGQELARASLVKANALWGLGQRDAAIALAQEGLADLDRGGVNNVQTRNELMALIRKR
jgi:tetratricopeptide (TPR) repeat protein